MPKGVGEEQKIQEQGEGFRNLSPEEQQRKQKYDVIFEDQAQFDKMTYGEKKAMFQDILLLNAKMHENYDEAKADAMMLELEGAKQYLDKAIDLLIQNVKTASLCLQELMAEYLPVLAFGETIYELEVDKKDTLDEFQQYKLKQLQEDDLALQQEAAKNAQKAAPEVKVEEVKPEEKKNEEAKEEAKPEEVKQDKVSRPWDNVENKRDVEKLYGPEKADDGTTREEFFDRMKAQGWNKEGDEKIIAAFYVRCSDDLRDNPDNLKMLMAQPAGTYRERGKVAEMALKIHPVNSTSDNQQTMEFRLKGVVEQSPFMARLQEEGWTQEGDEKIIDIMAKVPDVFIGKSGEKKLWSELLKFNGKSAYGRRDAITLLKENAKHSLHEPELAVLDAEEKRLEKEIERINRESELKKNSVLRSYFDRILELGLDQFEPAGMGMPDWATEGRFENVELDDPHMLDEINAQIDKLQIDEKKLAEGQVGKLREELKGPFEEIVKSQFGREEDENLRNLLGFDYEDFSEHMQSAEELKKYLKDALKEAVIEQKRQQLIEADKEKNPHLYQRQDKVNSAVEKVSNVLRLLQGDSNQKFLSAARGKQDTSQIPVENVGNYGRKHDFEQDSEAAQTEMFSILDKLAALKKENKLESLADLRDAKSLEDPFWDTYSRTLTDKEIGDLKVKFTKLSEAGIDWFEYRDTGAYEKFLKANNIKIGGAFDPYEIAKQSCNGPLAEENLKMTCSVPNYQQTMKCLDLIAAEYEKKKEAIADMDVETITGWFGANGYNMMENSILAVNGFEEKMIDGRMQKVIDLGAGIDVEKLDRDRLNDAQYKKLVDSAQEAKELYAQNERSFRAVFNVMNTRKVNSNFGGALIGVQENINAFNKNPELLGKLNRFRHLLYQVRQADQRVCKLVDINEKTKAKTEVIVEPLEENAQFDKQLVAQEVGFLKVCYNMVHEPSTRVSRNSGEYESVMRSILNAQKALEKKYDTNEEARKAYVKAINKVLNNINRYRMHKANDGFKQDATLDKFVALERVDKLLRTRFETLAQREYDDVIGAVPELFKVEVEEDKLGDEYLLEKAIGKINNMHKTIEDYRKEIDAEEAGRSRRNSIGGIRSKQLALDEEEPIQRSMSLGGIRAEKPAVKQEAPKAPENKAPEGKEPENKEPENKAPEIKAPENAVPAPKKEAPVEEKALFSEDKVASVKQAMDKEEDYRKELDPEDEFEKELIVYSAEKSLYVDTLVHACSDKAKDMGEEDAKKLLEKGMKDFAKASSVQFRVFKFEKLGDKDFNKEFQKRVLEGVAKGKTSQKDIREFRDAALKDCYTKYKGKDTKALDRLSKLLGSKVNAKAIQKAQEGVKKKADVKVQVKK
ncbi:MAG: hypothetical protein IJ147_02535 [Lachnospiraceae bacterium]|nr:hypothetical protein [Lachnospiraceae bacterium]